MTWWWGRRQGCWNVSVVVEAFSAEPHTFLTSAVSRSLVVYCKSCCDFNRAVWRGDSRFWWLISAIDVFLFLSKHNIWTAFGCMDLADTRMKQSCQGSIWIKTKTCLLIFDLHGEKIPGKWEWLGRRCLAERHILFETNRIPDPGAAILRVNIKSAGK